MYQVLLSSHSIFRYVVIGLALVVLFRAIAGLMQKRPYTDADDKASLFFMISWDLMFLFGILLYAVFSPWTKAAFQDFGAAMKDPTLRFFGLEHALMMLIALTLVHIGRSKAKKAPNDAAKHRTNLIFFGLATLIALYMIPWNLRGFWPA